ncbi:MAG: histidine kinase dimerization/phosphoacceptor domain -containing protein [Balneolales bacterium]
MAKKNQHKQLKVLHLEDSADDTKFVQRTLRKALIDCEFKVVDNKDDYRVALKDFFPDIILSDHSMPHFDSIQACEIFKQENRNIPFILVTGNVSEEFAVESLQRGADDYILKSSLERLPNAVKRSLEKKKTENQRDELDRKLKASLKEKDALLKEKDYLLQEVHHRVKNNLAIISSLLNIQASSVKDEGYKSLLIESENRVKSMGMIHEMLYQQDDFSSVPLESYILKLVQFLSSNYSMPGLKVNYDVQAKDVYLDMNTAIPCALIMNELISNAFKHAFQDQDNGEIMVSITQVGNQYTLMVKDNGIGFPEWKEESTVGMSLVHGLTRQIGGKATIERNNGTAFIITFTC